MSNSLIIIIWTIYFLKETVIIHSNAFSSLFRLVMPYCNDGLHICFHDSNLCLFFALLGFAFWVQFSQFNHYHVQFFTIPWNAVCQAYLFITNSWSLLKLMSIKSVMPSNHPILCCPLLLLFSIFPSIKVFSNESVLPIRWPKYWHLSFSISPSNEYSELISFRIDWLDLLAVQETLKSLLHHHSSKV